MSALAFDTLAYARRMEAVGFSRDQAEAMADEQAKIIDERLATKADLEAFRIATKADLEAYSRAMKADIGAVKIDIEALRIATKADIEALRIATKADIEALRIATKADIEALRIGTKADMAETKSEILKWIMGTIGIQTVVIIGAVLALARVVPR